MMTIRRSGRNRRGLGVALGFLALFVQILVPPGFMIGGHASGGVPLVICTGHGALVSAADLATVDEVAPERATTQKAPKPRARDACPFVGYLGVSTPPPTPRIEAVVYAWPAQPRPTIADRPVERLMAPPPPAQGPPGLA